MEPTRIIAIIQARMSSRRFPGKVLAPFLGKPVLAHVAERLRLFSDMLPVVVATSSEETDDPLACYAESLGLGVVRGPLQDVVGRFLQTVERHPCEAFFRVCADSPLLEPFLFTQASEVYASGDYDLVTNVFPRTFPPGMSVELLRTEAFLSFAHRNLAPQDREHATRYIYDHQDLFRIHNMACAQPADPDLKLAVDELPDLERLARWRREHGGWKCTAFRM